MGDEFIYFAKDEKPRHQCEYDQTVLEKFTNSFLNINSVHHYVQLKVQHVY